MEHKFDSAVTPRGPLFVTRQPEPLEIAAQVFNPCFVLLSREGLSVRLGVGLLTTLPLGDKLQFPQQSFVRQGQFDRLTV